MVNGKGKVDFRRVLLSRLPAMRAPGDAPPHPTWLDSRTTLLLLLLAAALPLVWPTLPPLVDLPAHMGRWRVQTAIDQVPSLAAAFDFQWRLIGNLGVDLLVHVLTPLFGVELSTKLVVLSIPVIMAGGMIMLVREVHGRVPPTVLFAISLAYTYPFFFGFVNFWLAQALVFPLLALWLRLGKQGRYGFRAMLFLPLGFLLWVAHTVGWGLLGLCAFGSEMVLQRRRGRGWISSLWHAGLNCLPLAVPLVPMLLVNMGSRAPTGKWFQWDLKLLFTLSVFRDRWKDFEVGSAALLYTLVGFGFLARDMFRVQWTLGVPALLCAVTFILMPRIVTGSNYADMRLVPFALALFLLSLDLPEAKARVRRGLAIAGALFLAVRIGAVTWSFYDYSERHVRELRALEHVERGSSVLSLVSRGCPRAWSTARLDHLPSMAIVRRDAFTNDQWTADNAQLIRIRKQGLGRYAGDPSEILYPRHCSREGSVLEDAVRDFNRDAYDYVWTLDVPPGRVRQPDLKLIWSNGASALYRVDKSATIDTPAGSGTRPTR